MQEPDDICLERRTEMPAVEETPAWEVRQYGVPLLWCAVLRDDWLAYWLRRYSFVLKTMKHLGQEVDPDGLKSGPLQAIQKAMRLCLLELRSGNWIATGICKEALNERREIKPEVWSLLDPAKPSLDWLSNRVELNGVFYELIRVRPLEPVPFNQAVIAFADPAIAEDVVESLQVHDARLAHQRLVYAAAGLLPDLRSGRYRTHAWAATPSDKAMPDHRREVGAEEWSEALEKIEGDQVTFRDGRTLNFVTVTLPAPLKSGIVESSVATGGTKTPKTVKNRKKPEPAKDASVASRWRNPGGRPEHQSFPSWIAYGVGWLDGHPSTDRPTFTSAMKKHGASGLPEGEELTGESMERAISRLWPIIEGPSPALDGPAPEGLQKQPILAEVRLKFRGEIMRLAYIGEIKRMLGPIPDDKELAEKHVTLDAHMISFCRYITGIEPDTDEVIRLIDDYTRDVVRNPKKSLGQKVRN